MDTEPSAKRRRTLSPELGQPYNDDPYPAQFLEEPADDDEAYEALLERVFADPRFPDTVAKIFDKYAKNAHDPGSSNGAAAVTPVETELAYPLLSGHGNLAAQISGPGITLSAPRFAEARTWRHWCGPFLPVTRSPNAWESEPMRNGMPGVLNAPRSALNSFVYARGPGPQDSSPALRRGQLPIQQEGEPKQNPAVAVPPVSKCRKGPHPRFSRNGKRLGRPPKTTSAKGMHDVTAHNGEGGDSGACRPQHSRNKVDDAVSVEDEDADVSWEDIAEAMCQTPAAVNLVGRKGAILSKKRRAELLAGSDAEEDPQVVEKEQELRKLYQQLVISGKQDFVDDQIKDNERRRRSGRKRMQVDFCGKVSWKTYCARRKVKHKITLVLRSLVAKERRLREQKSQANGDAEADVDNGRTGPAEQCSEQKAAEMHAVTPEPTVTGLQETAMALTACSLATPDASSDNEASTKRHNTETYDEDCLLSDDEAPAILARKAQPKLHLHSSASPDLRATKRAPKPWTMPEFTVGLRETQAIFAELEDMA